MRREAEKALSGIDEAWNIGLQYYDLEPRRSWVPIGTPNSLVSSATPNFGTLLL